MGKKRSESADPASTPITAPRAGKPSSLLDTRIVYRGFRQAQSSRDNLEQLAKLPDACVDLIYIDPAPVSEVELPFNSNRNYEVFRGEMKEKRAFEDRHANGHKSLGFSRIQVQEREMETMLTLEEEKRLVLLIAIIDLGGAPSKSQALNRILDEGYLLLDKRDLAIMANRDEEFWRNDMAYIRHHLVLTGYLDREVHNQWRITERGRTYAGELLKKSKPHELSKATKTAWERGIVATS